MREKFLILLVGLLLGALALKWLDEQSKARIVQAQVPVPEASELTPGEERIIALFENAQGSVVAITTARQVFDPFSQRRQDVPRGTGSGFVWDGEGHIVTNFHVIDGATGAQVRMADGRLLDAKLVGTDQTHDLAVLLVDASDGMPPAIPVGRSGEIRVGQAVLAIGNPFGLDWTLTTGVVSALDRQIPGDAGQVIGGLIQTDAAINPGNSGGPLIDSNGRLIGVNTAIYSPSGSSAGIGFAVPVDTVMRVVPQLIATGRYSPPVLGVRHDDRVDALARRNGIEGVLVLRVEPGSPAEAAGLAPATGDRQGRIVPGDVLTAVDGVKLKDGDGLRQALDAKSPGDTLVLEVTNGGRTREVAVELAAP